MPMMGYGNENTIILIYLTNFRMTPWKVQTR